MQTHVLKLSDPVVFDSLKDSDFRAPGLVPTARLILAGRAYEAVQHGFSGARAKIRISEETQPQDLVLELKHTLQAALGQLQDRVRLLIAVALLQTFIQNNYTGPLAETSLESTLFDLSGCNQNSTLQRLLIHTLAVSGQNAYEMTRDPILLVLSLLILEELSNEKTLLAEENTLPAGKPASPFDALVQWWKARALLCHISLLPEPAGAIASITLSIFASIEMAHTICNALPDEVTQDYKKSIYAMYYMENVKASLALNTENQCLESLTKVQKLLDFKFVLTGGRAKRTKYQTKSHSGLLILAESSQTQMAVEKDVPLPESFALNSDLLLEKPQFDSIGDEPLESQILKKQKIDGTNVQNGLLESQLLPIALRQEDIPQPLLNLDPNNQPLLSSFDNLQLLLRLYAVKKSAPAKDPLVEEELLAILSRVIHQDGPKNWTIFSRALWERSDLESTRAKTVERGILQMQSLVEELGLKIGTKIVPENKEIESSYMRMKYIHQLPYLPRWELDATLAEKYMSLGILRSAVEIYERLSMWCEAALCHAAVGDERTAEEILLKRIDNNPTDARAYSILGDIRQDPNLWEKSWQIGKYVNAKNSLARYYYNPPPSSRLEKNYDLALKHLNDSLKRYPISFDTWYFYGCIGLECNRLELAAEAFSRCVSLDQTHGQAWSNLSASYVELGKLKEALSCIKQASACDSQKNWRIWHNYVTIAMKLHEWDDVLMATRKLLEITKEKMGESAIDLPVIEKLVELLLSTDYTEDGEQEDENFSSTFTYFQRSCTDLVCNILPSVINTDERAWKLVAKVELWRRRPWSALECHEKAFRAISHKPEVETNEKIWDQAVNACEDLVAAYESFGEMEGKYGSTSLVCKDWKYKARSSVKFLISKGKGRWEGSDGWEQLMNLRSQI